MRMTAITLMALALGACASNTATPRDGFGNSDNENQAFGSQGFTQAEKIDSDARSTNAEYGRATDFGR